MAVRRFARNHPHVYSSLRTMSTRTKPRLQTTPATATEVAVLGLLTEGERSGYDLLRVAERSVGFFWTPAKTQMYAILRRLVDQGYATVRRVRQDQRPDKYLYRITELGEDRLREGLEHVGSSVNKNPLELKIFFGEHRPLAAVMLDLETVRDNARAHLARLEEIEQTFDHDEHLFPYLTLLRGKANAAADAKWAERCLALLREKR
jgi:PadR family transcriptional regulator, regulatory protein AphA